MSEERKPGRPVSERTLSRAKKAAMISNAEVTEVWNYWLTTMSPGEQARTRRDND